MRCLNLPHHLRVKLIGHRFVHHHRVKHHHPTRPRHRRVHHHRHQRPLRNHHPTMSRGLGRCSCQTRRRGLHCPSRATPDAKACPGSAAPPPAPRRGALRYQLAPRRCAPGAATASPVAGSTPKTQARARARSKQRKAATLSASARAAAHPGPRAYVACCLPGVTVPRASRPRQVPIPLLPLRLCPATRWGQSHEPLLFFVFPCRTTAI